MGVCNVEHSVIEKHGSKQIKLGFFFFKGNFRDAAFEHMNANQTDSQLLKDHKPKIRMNSN